MVKEEYNPQEGYTKGGGLRGPPKRWSGRGPPPARHIPWPEIFKHHLSSIEGHMKMLDMIRKHTAEGSGNWRTVCTMIERTQEMLRMTKEVNKSFVPPSNTIDKVPIGSSSLSMYPGYSPADHQYGKAAQEVGQEWAEAKRKGVEFQPAKDGPQYEIGQASKRRKKSIEETRAELAEREAMRDRALKNQDPVVKNQDGLVEPSQLLSSETGEEAWKVRAAMSGQPVLKSQGKQKKQKQRGTDGKKPGNKSASADSAAFFIDSNPTPPNLASVPVSSRQKRAAGEEGLTGKSKKSKKVKVNHNFTESAPLIGNADTIETSTTAPLPDATSASQRKEPHIEFDDITAEVDARMAEKEERRKSKREKKRKRGESEEPAGEGKKKKTKKGKEKGSA